MTSALFTEEIHPIDIAEEIAEGSEWSFDRITDDQIALAVEGQWRIYSISLAWSAHDSTLRLVCTFDLDQSDDHLPRLYELINQINDACWTGAFTWWSEQKMMVYRYGLLLAGDQIATPEQINIMIAQAVAACERYYPAFSLVIWSNHTPKDALGRIISDSYGRA